MSLTEYLSLAALILIAPSLPKQAAYCLGMVCVAALGLVRLLQP